MKLRRIIREIIKENNQDKLYRDLVSIKTDIAKAAQNVYNQWEQDEEGVDEMYGSGGICDDIADAMCNAVQNKTKYNCFHLYNEYECHTSIYVYDTLNKKIYNVDIPPHVYEKGYGYNWKKIKDVTFSLNDVKITELDYEDYIDDKGNIKDEWS